MKYDIEQDVDITEYRRPYKYPFPDMEPGDSFFVELEDGRDPRKLQRSLYSCWRRHDGLFTSRHVDEDGVEGIRVWRVE